MERKIIIIGAGAAGLSAALELAKRNIPCILVSAQPSQRAQSVMAEGGINAAVCTQTDSPELHAQETMAAGRFLADEQAIRCMTAHAPELVKALLAAGMSFSLERDKKPAVRAFGGQKQKRTVYAVSNTGRQLMHTLIDQTRRYEVEKLITRYVGWQFARLLQTDGQTYGCVLYHPVRRQTRVLYGSVIVASGGLNGLFGNTTGSVRNTGSVTARLFASGVPFANGEFIQFHPTTASLHGKNMLITEAARGEGGRLFVALDGKPYYFMEAKYPEMGNLMTRDVISREEWSWIQKGYTVYLDLRGLDQTIYDSKLCGVIEDCQEFLSLDPKTEPIPVTPGIHFFMGGIQVDGSHRTMQQGLYAAGECACQYHGANRLGGNSLLAALHGGMVAAQSAAEDWDSLPEISSSQPEIGQMPTGMPNGDYVHDVQRMQDILRRGLGVVRCEQSLRMAIEELEQLTERVNSCYDEGADIIENQSLRDSCLLGQAMLQSALARNESRGAHFRSDYPEEREEYQKQTVAVWDGASIRISLEKGGRTT